MVLGEGTYYRVQFATGGLLISSCMQELLVMKKGG